MKISKELYIFFKEWLEWAESDGKNNNVFGNYAGLCSNLRSWRSHKGLSSTLPDELVSTLRYARLNVKYPFDEEDYYYRLGNGTQNECPKRRDFVSKQIKKYEE